MRQFKKLFPQDGIDKSAIKQHQTDSNKPIMYTMYFPDTDIRMIGPSGMDTAAGDMLPCLCYNVTYQMHACVISPQCVLSYGMYKI